MIHTPCTCSCRLVLSWKAFQAATLQKGHRSSKQTRALHIPLLTGRKQEIPVPLPARPTACTGLHSPHQDKDNITTCSWYLFPCPVCPPTCTGLYLLLV